MLFKGSVVSRLARALICIIILSVLSTGLALITVVSSLRDAEAVNISGSLRMQSYRLAYDIATQSADLTDHLAQYRQSLNAPALAQLNRFYIPDNVRLKYLALLDRWRQLEQNILENNASLYLAQVSEYVTQLDNFVLALQLFSEQKLWGASIISVIGIMTTLGVVFFTIHSTRKQIVSPLNRLVQASKVIQSGNFNHPRLDTSLPNELGLLSTAFTTMSSELAKLYRSLEDKVAEKTKMLTEANKTLGVLYGCSQALNSSQINEECFKNVLKILGRSEQMSAIQLEIYDSGEGLWSINSGQIDEKLVWHNMPLKQNESLMGQLRWQSAANGQPHPHLLKNVANMLSRGIYLNRAQKQHLQLLLMEERATIARELHDSLAQALSFLRIQITLLKRALPAENEKALIVATDFEQALATAYQQLRELLTTFRLSIEEADLHEALNQLINPLQKLSHATIRVNCTLASQSLNAQQQVHALQIVREAVTNAIKHAEAQNIIINCEYAPNGYNMFTISDDGKGMASIDEPAGHYGLNIMRERAQHLDGTIELKRRPGGGTTVQLVFPH